MRKWLVGMAIAAVVVLAALPLFARAGWFGLGRTATEQSAGTGGYTVVTLDELWNAGNLKGFASVEAKMRYVDAVNNLVMRNLQPGGAKPVFAMSPDGRASVVTVRQVNGETSTIQMVLTEQGWVQSR